MTRVIRGLKWARALDARPSCIPVGRPRGAKAAGLRYERALAAALPGAKHGQWFEFEDLAGRGYCQVDLLLDSGLRKDSLGRVKLLILESKYTWTFEGHQQIEGLYRPVVERAYGCSVLGIVVAKRLIPGVQGIARICGGLEEAIAAGAGGGRVVLHWLGKGALTHGPKGAASGAPYIRTAGASPGIIPPSPRSIGL